MLELKVPISTDEIIGAVKSLKQIPLYDASKPMAKDNHPAMIISEISA
jgi:hypothetical protein